MRARVEHIFQIIKQLWGHRKVRYRGLAKNEAHYFSLLALANLYIVRKKTVPEKGVVSLLTAPGSETKSKMHH